MNVNKKTALGITGAAAAALIVVGAATPAMASEGHDGDSTTTVSSKSYEKYTHFTNESPIVIAPDVDLLGGGVANGDILGGNVIGSGNDTLSGNDVTAPILSGNETAVGNGNSTDVSDIGTVSSDVSDLVDSVTDVSDIVDVDDILGDVSGWVNLDGMFD